MPGDSNDFAGTGNVRHLRVIAALRVRARTRKSIDGIAGASNGPALIADLRALALDIPCTRIPTFDRDGREVLRGVYHLSASDRHKLTRWATRTARRGAA
ncbi:hypothetical protein E1N52_41635 [Paraburkholderia guartelaensis]|uniref:Uncharacterized protein n=1 Tax=Paraburkholderia guartelaensis TaxID=2546446 RepID=A0A4R5L374_9BURK|nr:hypothetical protein E1N52_41635 [Paraburkholderia guartelaensis]